MTDQHAILAALMPVIILLGLGVVAAVGSRSVGLNPIVGYLLLGLGLSATGMRIVSDSSTIALLAELGVIFLLFDIGLHFSLTRIRAQARDIFGFGAAQVAAATVALSAVAFLLGLHPLAAFIVGATLSLSSTAVVAGLVTERSQQNCPVGLTATSILIFQDVAAILLLIVVGAVGTDEQVLSAIAAGLTKAALAFCIAIAFARIVARPLFNVISRGRREEVFTAMALLVALAAAWLTGMIGLSLTLGAFLAGMVIAETPYRPIIQSEISPFRGLLLSFFFISVGLSIDVQTLGRLWPAVIGVAGLLIMVKIVTNALAGRAFRWSLPGSVQLAFLISQGSEFAFVILLLPAVRQLVGPTAISVIIPAVALSLALTPTLAQTGRWAAGRMRARAPGVGLRELEERDLAGPVFIAGMGHVGRSLADALNAFGIDYSSIERDDRRLREAVADGYRVVFGNFADPRIWQTLGLQGRRICVLTAASLQTYKALSASRDQFFPDLMKVAVVTTEAEVTEFAELGVSGVIDRSTPRGLDVAALVLHLLDVDPTRISAWMTAEQERSLSSDLIVA